MRITICKCGHEDFRHTGKGRGYKPFSFPNGSCYIEDCPCKHYEPDTRRCKCGHLRVEHAGEHNKFDNECKHDGRSLYCCFKCSDGYRGHCMVGHDWAGRLFVQPSGCQCKVYEPTIPIGIRQGQ